MVRTLETALHGLPTVAYDARESRAIPLSADPERRRLIGVALFLFLAHSVAIAGPVDDKAVEQRVERDLDRMAQDPKVTLSLLNGLYAPFEADAAAPVVAKRLSRLPNAVVEPLLAWIRADGEAEEVYAKPVIKLLDSRDSKVRVAAAGVIPFLGEHGIRELLAILKDPSDRYVYTAAAGSVSGWPHETRELILEKRSSLVSALAKGVEGPDWVCYSTIAMIDHLDIGSDKAVPILVKVLSGSDSRAYNMAVRVLERYGDAAEGAIAALISSLESNAALQDLNYMHGARALFRIGGTTTQVKSAFARLLRKHELFGYYQIAARWQDAADPDPADLLRQLSSQLNNNDKLLAMAAATAAAAAGEKALDHICRISRIRNPAIPELDAGAIDAIGPSVFSALHNALTQRQIEARIVADCGPQLIEPLMAWIRTGTGSISTWREYIHTHRYALTPLLVAALRDGDGDASERAASALLQIGGSAIREPRFYAAVAGNYVEMLMNVAEDNSASATTRGYAFAMLGMMGRYAREIEDRLAAVVKADVDADRPNGSAAWAFVRVVAPKADHEELVLSQLSLGALNFEHDLAIPYVAAFIATDRPAIVALIKTLDSFESLGRGLGAAAAAELTALALDTAVEPHVRARAAVLLGCIGPGAEKSADELASMLEGSDDPACGAALAMIGTGADDDGGRAALIRIASDTSLDDRPRLTAIGFMYRYPEFRNEYTPALNRLTDDPEVQEYAEWVVSKWNK